MKRALGLFDEVIIGVGYNEQKSGWMPVDERLAAISRLYADEPRVKVVSYTGLTADFAKENGVTAIVRGVRTMADYDYEMQMADGGVEGQFRIQAPAQHPRGQRDHVDRFQGIAERLRDRAGRQDPVHQREQEIGEEETHISFEESRIIQLIQLNL